MFITAFKSFIEKMVSHALDPSFDTTYRESHMIFGGDDSSDCIGCTLADLTERATELLPQSIVRPTILKFITDLGCSYSEANDASVWLADFLISNGFSGYIYDLRPKEGLVVCVVRNGRSLGFYNPNWKNNSSNHTDTLQQTIDAIVDAGGCSAGAIGSKEKIHFIIGGSKNRPECVNDIINSCRICQKADFYHKASTFPTDNQEGLSGVIQTVAQLLSGDSPEYFMNDNECLALGNRYLVLLSGGVHNQPASENVPITEKDAGNHG